MSMNLPLYSSLDEVRAAASTCYGCDRSQQRSTVVFGHGNPDSELMIVAEYPSESDDLTGRPFSGPAGELLERLLNASGVTRDQIWITNLVRCYATETGTRGDRIQPATLRQQRVCSTWLNLELQFVNPRVILALGAPAAAALISRDFRLTEQRGSWQRLRDGKWAIATMQPAYILRLEQHDPERAAASLRLIEEDIRAAAIFAGLTPESE